MNNMKLTACCLSHIGTSRESHEDNFLFDGKIIIPEQQKQMSLQREQVISLVGSQARRVQLFAISDGMGGHNSGEVASLITVQMLSVMEVALERCSTPVEMAALCQKGLNAINQRICTSSHEQSELRNMGATVILLVKYINGNVMLNFGDSRGYFFDGHSLQQITKDHTEGQRLLDLKLLTSEEVQVFPAKGNLSKYMGMNIGDADLKVDEFYVSSDQEGWFLLCSDGLTSALANNDIEEILRGYYPSNRIEQAGKVLLDGALQGVKGRRGSTDNITIILVMN